MTWKPLDGYTFRSGFSFERLTLEALSGGRGGGVQSDPLDFFGFKLLLLDRLAKALVQLFFVR